MEHFFRLIWIRSLWNSFFFWLISIWSLWEFSQKQFLVSVLGISYLVTKLHRTRLNFTIISSFLLKIFNKIPGKMNLSGKRLSHSLAAGRLIWLGWVVSVIFARHLRPDFADLLCLFALQGSTLSKPNVARNSKQTNQIEHWRNRIWNPFTYGIFVFQGHLSNIEQEGKYQMSRQEFSDGGSRQKPTPLSLLLCPIFEPLESCHSWVPFGKDDGCWYAVLA